MTDDLRRRAESRILETLIFQGSVTIREETLPSR